MTTIGTAWPLFDLRVRTPRLELRYASDVELAELAGFREPGKVIGDGEEPFDGDSSFYASGPPARWRAISGEWGARAKTSPEWWHLAFAVRVGDELVGQQNMTAADFLHLRTVNTFSFLARSAQGRGLGREMRAAVLHLAFAGLGAERAESDAFADNDASIGVSRSLGYEPNGTMLAPRPSGSALMLRFLLTRERWEAGAGRLADIELHGVDAARPLLGLT